MAKSTPLTHKDITPYLPSSNTWVHLRFLDGICVAYRFIFLCCVVGLFCSVCRRPVALMALGS
jgi:hypothetical protein